MSQDHRPPLQLTEADIQFLSTHLRGVTQARIRFLGADPALEVELVNVLRAMGTSVTTERLAQMAPYPKRKFGIRYRNGTAIVTVVPDGTLTG